MKRVYLVLLLVGALALAVFTAPSASASHAVSVKTVAQVVHQPVAPSAQKASQRNIGPNAWDRSTILIQVMKDGTSTEHTWLHERISYYRNVAGSTLSIVEGSCQVNMPCIRVYWDNYVFRAGMG